MDMTITKGQRDLLIGLAGVLIAVLCWFLVASPNIEKREALEAENETLRPKAEEYQAVHARVDEYRESIVTLTNTEEDIVKHFPARIEREDQLMFWSNVDAAYPMDLRFGDIELGEWDAVAVAGVEEGQNTEVTYDEDGNPVVPDAAVTDIKADYKLYGATMAMQFISSYDGMKDLFTYINSLNDKNSIDSFEIYYDESNGYLQGALGMRLYYLEGTGKEYQPYFVPSVPTGVEDVFRTGGIDLEQYLAFLADALEEAVESNTDKIGEAATQGSKNSKKSTEESAEASQTAYIRKGDGTVYHTDRDCEYIKGREVTETTVDKAKEQGFPKCPKCVK